MALEIRTTAGPSRHVQWVIERRPVHDGVAGAAMPGGVSTAAVAEAGDMPDEDLIRAEGVPVGAAGWWLGYPLPSGISDEVSDDGHTSRVEAARSSSRASDLPAPRLATLARGSTT